MFVKQNKYHIMRNRFKAAIIDFTISYSLVIPFTLFFNVDIFFQSLLSAILFSSLFCKDLVNGRSIGKRLMGLQVYSMTKNKKLSPMQLIGRNLFLIFWLIEFIVLLVNPKERIGDYVFKTKVEDYVEGKQSKMNPIIIIISFVITFIILWWLSYYFLKYV